MNALHFRESSSVRRNFFSSQPAERLKIVKPPIYFISFLMLFYRMLPPAIEAGGHEFHDHDL